LDCDRETAFYYLDIKRYLQARKIRIPENDIWIAATAMQHNLILVTRDKSFDDIVGLSIQKW
jgi:tRNA(fMet)-specific endonuclease VapC